MAPILLDTLVERVPFSKNASSYIKSAQHKTQTMIIIIIIIKSMGWGYVSELRPPKGLSFFPQVIYEYGEMVE
jgi:hypothetical protein